MELIERFVENVLNHDNSFEIEYEKTYYFFIQGYVGKAKYVYCQYGFRKNFQTSMDERMELVAIVSNETVFVINKFRLGVWRCENNLPANVVLFDDYIKEINDFVEKTVFPEFCKTLSAENISVDIDRCKELAREYALLNREYRTLKFSNVYNGTHAASILCGFADIRDCAMDMYESHRETWEQRKASEDAVRGLLYNYSIKCDPSVAKQWEIKMATALRSIDAKTVTVEFTLNDRVANDKINTDTLIRTLFNYGYFSDFDFTNRKSGKKTLSELGATGWGSDKNALHCEDIRKITYGRKTIYER